MWKKSKENLKVISVDNHGFLLLEIMFTFSIMTLFLISTLTLSRSMQILREKAKIDLERMKNDIPNLENQYKFSEYDKEMGRNNCFDKIDYDISKFNIYNQGIELGSSNISTDIEVRNGFIYLTADSASASLSDFFIIDFRILDSPRIISSINTGPGISSLEIAGHYAYLANLSTLSQLQIIDISNRNNPVLISSLKLPLPEASSTAPNAKSIFYYKNKIYLGTEKWEGNEFSIIDVSNPYFPVYIGGFETNTLINDIYIKNNTAYLATSDIKQMRILDISDTDNIRELGSFSPSGSLVQEGKVLSFFENRYIDKDNNSKYTEFSLGRTVGGFNNISNHEIFLFPKERETIPINSKDIPGGVYGIVIRPPNIYISTKSPNKELQIFDESLQNKILDYPLGFLPNSFTCDRNVFYFSTANHRGIVIMKII